VLTIQKNKTSRFGRFFVDTTELFQNLLYFNPPKAVLRSIPRCLRRGDSLKLFSRSYGAFFFAVYFLVAMIKFSKNEIKQLFR
jgi:hypothetical protein